MILHAYNTKQIANISKYAIPQMCQTDIIHIYMHHTG